MFGFFSKKDSGTSKEPQRPAWLLSLQVDNAIVAHENWKTRLETLIGGKSEEDLDPRLVSRDDQCDLGKWIYSKDLEPFHGTEEYERLKYSHKDFHFHAGSIVSLCRCGDHKKAADLLRTHYRDSSDKVLFMLRNIKKAF